MTKDFIMKKGILFERQVGKVSQEEQIEIERTLDKLRPYLLKDGGNCEFVDFQNGIVEVRLLGACATCPSSDFTLTASIEQRLLDTLPYIKGVKQVF